MAVKRQPIRVGVIGAGNIATLGHIPGLRRTRDAEVVAICDQDLTRANDVAARLRIGAAYDDHRRMLGEVPLDAVTVATPPSGHAPVVLEALRVGVHVLCEKPLATNLSDAERMVEAADRAGVILAMNMQFRMLRETMALRSAVESGHLGRVHYAHIRYLRHDFPPRPGSWTTERRLSGGGALSDMGPHVIDLALWLCGASSARSVEAHMHPTAPRGSDVGARASEPLVEDFASLRLRLDTGATAVVECSWRFPGTDESRIQLVGDRGGGDVSVWAGGRTAPLRFFTQAQDDEPPASGGPQPPDASVRLPSLAFATGATWRPQPRRARLWYASMASFVAAIRGQAPPVATGRDGLAVQQVLDAAYRSAATARRVSILRRGPKPGP
ncbi:Gfo/Idh/MocA family oxidoreductase [soil metagenome]